MTQPKIADAVCRPVMGPLARMVRVGLLAGVLAGGGAGARAQTAAAPGAPAPGAPAEVTAPIGPALDLAQYRVIFNEDFNTLDVSADGPGTRWTAHTPWHGDFGDARFANPGPNGPFSVKQGVLGIEARKTPGGQWQSGMLSSLDARGVGFGARYGYFEMRAKLPAGKGVWPSFWLDSYQANNQTEPTLEVNVFEYYGQFPSDLHSTVHVWPSREDVARTHAKEQFWATTSKVEPGSLTSAFHTYGADVEPDFITIYLDRQPLWRTPTPKVHTAKLGVLIDLALGSGWPITETPNPSVMLVDYVRVWVKR